MARRLTRLLAAILACGAMQIASAQLFGVTWDDGKFYRISTSDASTTLIGETGVPHLTALTYLGFDTMLAFSVEGEVYRVDVDTGRATRIGPVRLREGETLFEGALANYEIGLNYASSIGVATEPYLFTMSTAGAVTARTRIVQQDGSPGAFDFNGWIYSDGEEKLYGIERESNSYMSVTPSTGRTSMIRALTPILGETGGMATVGNTGYFATGGLGGPVPGSHELWRINLADGTHVRVGAFDRAIGGKGFSGIAVPEPATGLIVAVAAGVVVLRRKRK